MKVGIYFRTAHPVATAIAAGFSVHEVHHREPTLYRGEVESFDLVVVNGWRSGKRVAKSYEAAGVPVLVVDFGYLKRVNAPDEYMQGHWQVGLGGLNRIPSFACPSDRFDALGLEITKAGGNPQGNVLVCGQVPGDAAHGMDAHSLREWLREKMREYPDAIYRPHPRGGIAIPGHANNHQPLADALAAARLIVTYNSNVGHDALLAGVPVVCGPGAAYDDLAGESLPSIEARREYFSRVAYGQWTAEEMASGEAQAFWLNHLVPGIGFDGLRDSRDVRSGPDGVLRVSADEPLQAAHDGAEKVQPIADQLVDGLDDLDAEQLRALAKERGVKVHARAGADKIREALRAAS
ncbi:hypothetical protein [Paracandidimonas soli]|uniref:Uncharacterized protein n=1 Tax=Paracandidimonas soli TaxID=1917182 RepID=A0A4R3UNP0_9BURK|nr:hypothetical protein [Paracandidimonas soli]TCU91624.1 hypothetical protein EV686_11720 [Paracandidimonas soli]